MSQIHQTFFLFWESVETWHFQQSKTSRVLELKKPSERKVCRKKSCGNTLPTQRKRKEHNIKHFQLWSDLFAVFLSLSLGWQGVFTACFAINFTLRGLFESQNTWGFTLPKGVALPRLLKTEKRFGEFGTFSDLCTKTLVFTTLPGWMES